MIMAIVMVSTVTVECCSEHPLHFVTRYCDCLWFEPQCGVSPGLRVGGLLRSPIYAARAQVLVRCRAEGTSGASAFMQSCAMGERSHLADGKASRQLATGARSTWARLPASEARSVVRLELPLGERGILCHARIPVRMLRHAHVLAPHDGLRSINKARTRCSGARPASLATLLLAGPSSLPTGAALSSTDGRQEDRHHWLQKEASMAIIPHCLRHPNGRNLPKLFGVG